MKNSQLKTGEPIRFSRKLIFFLLLLLAAAVPLFAQDIIPSGLNTVAGSVKAAFTSDIVKIILVCCLAGCGIAYGFNKDNEKMKRNVIAIAVAIVLVMAAQGIVDKIWSAAGS